MNQCCCLYRTSMELWGFCHRSVGKESACNAGEPSLIPGSGRFPGERIGYPFQYSGLENSKIQIRLNDFHFHGDFRHYFIILAFPIFISFQKYI